MRAARVGVMENILPGHVSLTAKAADVKVLITVGSRDSSMATNAIGDRVTAEETTS